MSHSWLPFRVGVVPPRRRENSCAGVRWGVDYMGTRLWVVGENAIEHSDMQLILKHNFPATALPSLSMNSRTHSPQRTSPALLRGSRSSRGRVAGSGTASTSQRARGSGHTHESWLSFSCRLSVSSVQFPCLTAGPRHIILRQVSRAWEFPRNHRITN
jgi:hypothetical protein